MRTPIKDRLPELYIWCIKNSRVPRHNRHDKEELSLTYLYYRASKKEDLKEGLKNFFIVLEHYLEYKDSGSKKILDSILNNVKPLKIKSLEETCDEIVEFYNLNGFLPRTSSLNEEERRLGRARHRMAKCPKFSNFLKDIKYRSKVRSDEVGDILTVSNYIQLNHKFPPQGSIERLSYTRLLKRYGSEGLKNLIPEIKKLKLSFKERVEKFRIDYVIGKKRPPKYGISEEINDFAWYNRNRKKLQELGINFKLEEVDLDSFIDFCKSKLRFPSLKLESERKYYNAWRKFKKSQPETISSLGAELQSMRFMANYKETVRGILIRNKLCTNKAKHKDPYYAWIYSNRKNTLVKNFIITFNLYKEGDPKATEIINLLKEKLGIK